MSSPAPFSGIDVLAPGESPSVDGYKFQGVDRLTIDRMLRVGDVTHKHDGHAALANPSLAPTASTASSGGAIAAATPIYGTYTLVDADGGESLPVAAVAVTTPAGYLDPFDAPIGVVDHTAGTLPAGDYSYAATVSDGLGGETVLSPSANVTVDPGHANSEVVLSGLATLVTDSSGGGGSWRLWRSQGGGPWYLIGTGTAATFTDNGVAGDCTIAPPASGTTVGANTYTFVIPAGQPAGAVSARVYASFDGSFTSPALLGTYALAGISVSNTYTDLLPTLGSPPPVSTCLPGANKIDPGTDLAQDGATDGEVLTWVSADSKWEPQAGGGGGGGGPTDSALGVNRIALATTPAIAASATTTINLVVPSWAEGNTWRVVMGLCITHPDASKLAATLNDPGADGPVTLFSAGSFGAVANIGIPAVAPGDPDALLYLSDGQYGNLFTDLGYIEPNPVITASSGLSAFGGRVYVPQNSINDLLSGVVAPGTWQLAITESGGSAGTLKAFALFLISSEFDALLAIPAPPGIGPWAALTPGTNASLTAFAGTTIGRAALDGLGTTQLKGQTHLDGTVKATGAIASGATFATLPSAAYHPFYDKHVAAIAQISSVMTNVILKVTSAGALSINSALATNDYVFLDGIALALQS